MIYNRLSNLIKLLNKNSLFSYRSDTHLLLRYAGRQVPIDKNSIEKIVAETAPLFAKKYIDKCLEQDTHPFFVFLLHAPINNELKRALKKTHGGIAFLLKDFATINISNVINESNDFDVTIAFSTDNHNNGGFLDYKYKKIVVVLSPSSLLIPDELQSWLNWTTSQKNWKVPSIASMKNVLTEVFHRTIYSYLTHEVTHAADLPTPSVEDVAKSKQKSKFEKLYEQEAEKGGAFYFTTREELKAYLSQIIAELENKDLDISQSLQTIIESSPTYVAVSYILETDKKDFENKDHMGKTIAARKHSARKYLLSSLYTWLEDKKQKLATSSL